MQTHHADTAHRVQVVSEYDVVTIRQNVRQLARVFGLGLAEQAKLAAAISGVARALLSQQGGAEFTIKTVGEGRRKMLEVVCPAPASKTCADTSTFGQAVKLDEVRLLVDEAAVFETGHGFVLTLRMRLLRVAQS